METQKKYLSVPQKLAYGSGDLGSNFFYSFVTSFALVYMTDAVGLEAGIVGTLIAVSKLLDGITDLFFGNLIDKTHSKMGKARPWMFFSGFPLAICLILIFAIPSSMAAVGQYVWFFIFYTCANAVFYTANNISYGTMSALITKSDSERVSLGTYRYIFAVIAGIGILSVTVAGVDALGGGMAGWRAIAIIYAVLFLIFNSLASLVCKEIVEEETESKDENKNNTTEKVPFVKALKIVFSNKYYFILVAIYLLTQTNTGIGNNVGVYYYTYILGNANLLGVTSSAALVIIVALMINPMLVKRFGIYKVNLVSYIANSVLSVFSVIFAYSANFAGIVVMAFLRSFTMGFLIGSLNALVAEVANNIWIKTNKHLEGMVFSCSSIGMKIGGGIGAAATGWILSAAGYVGTATVQTSGAMNAIKFTFSGLPFILTIVTTVCLFFMKVDIENKKLMGSRNLESAN